MFMPQAVEVMHDVDYQIATPTKHTPPTATLETFTEKVSVVVSPVKDDSKSVRQQVLPTGRSTFTSI
jgi:hypothetical protein